MNRLLILVTLILMSTASFANPARAERKKARQEHRLNRERFDNRLPQQKIIDAKILSVMAIVAIIIFRKVDDAQN